MKDEQKVVNEMITEILGSFDFATVRRVMDYMGWQWYQKRDVPTIYAMMKEAIVYRHAFAGKEVGV